MLILILIIIILIIIIIIFLKKMYLQEVKTAPKKKDESTV